MHMRSSHGEIEVFLCPDDPAVKISSNSGCTTTHQPVPSSRLHDTSSYLPPEFLVNSASAEVRVEPLHSVQNSLVSNENSIPTTISSVTSSSGMRDALLCESDDFGPMGGGKFQLQTEDQNSVPGKYRFSSFPTRLFANHTFSIVISCYIRDR